jgi:hypothetical protein
LGAGFRLDNITVRFPVLSTLQSIGPYEKPRPVAEAMYSEWETRLELATPALVRKLFPNKTKRLMTADLCKRGCHKSTN